MKMRDGWRTVAVEDLCSRVTSGGTPSRKNTAFYDGGTIPWVKSGDLKVWVVTETEEHITEQALQSSSAKLMPPDTVLLAMYGDGKTIGSVSLLGTPAATNQAVCCMMVDASVCEPRFLAYSLSCRREQLVGLALGASQRNLNGKTIKAFKLNVPSLPTQRRIAGILSAYDDLIENNTKRIKTLEEMARGLYREWFVRFRFPGHEKVEIVDSPLGQLPKGWKVVTLGELVEQKRESVNPEELDPTTPYFGLEHLPRRSITLGDWGVVGDVASTKLRAVPGDILFGKIRPYFHKVGSCPIEAVCSSDTIILRAREKKWSALALSVTSSDEFVAHATQTSGGTKMPRANWKVLVKYPVRVPSMRVLEQFNDLMNAIVARLRCFTFQNRNLKKTRDLLLPRLISGEIDVDKLNLPEVA